MTLYIRKHPKWVHFVNNVSELREFCTAYVHGTETLLGDLGRFNRPMINVLLRFLESNPAVDCYSSADLSDSVLLSRFTTIEKQNEPVLHSPSDEQFLQSPRTVLDADIHLTLPAAGKLLATGCSNFEFTLLKHHYGRSGN